MKYYEYTGDAFERTGTIDLPLDVSFGEVILVDAEADNRAGGFGKAFVSALYFAADGSPLMKRSGKQFESGVCQFHREGEFAYSYRFPVPAAARKAVVRVRKAEGAEVALLGCRARAVPLSGNDRSWDKPGAAPEQGIKCVAHLGFTGLAPRNTLPGFQLAANALCRECVTNINSTKDDVIVALHNDTIDETSNGHGLVYEYTLDELRKLDFGGYVSEVYEGTELPVIGDVLSLMARERMRPVLRLTARFEGEKHYLLERLYAEAESRVLAGSEGRGLCTAKGFSRKIMEDMAALGGDRLRYGFCTGQEITPELVGWVKTLGRDVYLDVRYPQLTREGISLALDAGVKVEAWIDNDFESIVTLAGMGVTGFTTDSYALDGCVF